MNQVDINTKINTPDKLVIAVSSRALFDLEDSHNFYEKNGVEAYCQYQIEHENELLKPGSAFLLVKKLLSLKDANDEPQVEVILVSKNSADTGLRVFNSISHFGLNITRAAFTNGLSPYRYIQPFNVHLFLSMDSTDVVNALNAGFAAATIFANPQKDKGQEKDLEANWIVKIAFDGDSVIFSDEAEKIYQSQGLQAFTHAEKSAANTPLPGGPFKNVLAAIHKIQSSYPIEQSPIRTALFTARAAPAHERVIRTLRAWNIRIDEALFLGGLNKAEFLRTFDADIYFDDQHSHISSTQAYVPSGHVPYGITNSKKD